jgi:sarcosine oxidase subunit alpha
LSKLDTDIDLASSVFPHLGMRTGTLLGLPARIYRVSFTGELTYEINVPADAGHQLWETLLQVGKSYGLAPVGLDAIMSLRLEKGFLHIGSDTDGTTVPDDVGWGKVALNKTDDYIGRRSLTLPEHVRPDRLQLVGLKSQTPFIIGSHLLLKDSKAATDGWVTSAGRETVTGEPIALALLTAGRAHQYAEVALYDAGKQVGSAQVVPTPFFDPGAERMHA